MIVFITWWVIAVLVFGAAFRWGARPERLSAVLMFIAYLLTPVAGLWAHPGLASGVLVIDALLAVGLLILSLKHARWWLLLAVANQGLVVIAHLTTVMDDSVWTRAAITSRTGFGLMVLFALAMGVAESRIALAAGYETSPRNEKKRLSLKTRT